MKTIMSLYYRDSVGGGTVALWRHATFNVYAFLYLHPMSRLSTWLASLATLLCNCYLNIMWSSWVIWQESVENVNKSIKTKFASLYNQRLYYVEYSIPIYIHKHAHLPSVLTHLIMPLPFCTNTHTVCKYRFNMFHTCIP